MNSSADRGPDRDSASSVHEAETQIFSAPMDIYPSNYAQGPSAPVPMHKEKRPPAWQRKRQQNFGATAGHGAASLAAKQRQDAEKEAGKFAQPKKSCLKQGGLSNALSREPSVHQGTRGLPSNTDDAFRRASFDVTEPTVGSWGERKVTFYRTDSAHTDDDGKHRAKLTPSSNDGVDADALTAALEALKTDGNEENEHISGSNGSPGIIIGDTSLAMDWPCSEDNDGPLRLAAEAAGRSDLGVARSAVSDCGPSSAPISTLRRAHSLGAAEVELIAEAGAGSLEWNSRFVKRWRAVKQRARLQALGMRSIWKLSSPGRGVHHQPELLTNDLPQGVLPGISINSVNAHGDDLDLDIASFSQGKNGNNRINRDPSLATMLLGEVAEVC